MEADAWAGKVTVAVGMGAVAWVGVKVAYAVVMLVAVVMEVEIILEMTVVAASVLVVVAADGVPMEPVREARLVLVEVDWVAVA